MTNDERNALIEECARTLEGAADGFIEVGSRMPEGEDRDTAYNLADAYHMAAEELRKMNPDYAAREERNMARVREWSRRLRDGKGVLPLPDLERGPKDH